MKTLNQSFNVGSAKYIVNFHDGKKKHQDGSKFFDIRIFKNKKHKDAFVKELIKNNYIIN
jgi:hypothetical protein